MPTPDQTIDMARTTEMLKDDKTKDMFEGSMPNVNDSFHKICDIMQSNLIAMDKCKAIQDIVDGIHVENGQSRYAEERAASPQPVDEAAPMLGNNYLRRALDLSIAKEGEYGKSDDLIRIIMHLLCIDNNFSPAVIASLTWVITKLTRFSTASHAYPFAYHIDSLDDLVVYSAMLRDTVDREIRAGLLSQTENPDFTSERSDYVAIKGMLDRHRK